MEENDPGIWVLTCHSHDYYEGWKDSFAGLFSSRHAINNKLTGFQLNGNAEWRRKNAHHHDDYYTAKVVQVQS